MATATQERSGENPLVEGLERLPVHPTTLVIFGATGDLARRKLLPGIYNLAHEGALPERFNLIGVSRGDESDEGFREIARESIKQFSRREADAKVLDSLVSQMRYVAGSFDEDDMYDRLSGVAAEFDKEAGMHFNRLYYLSVAPTFFPVIAEKLGQHGLAKSEGAETRMIIEKPFGTDLKSALELNRALLSVFERAAGLPHRPLPGQGDRPEHAGPAVRERDLRAALEPLLHRQRADHGGRGHRDRLARGLLRHLRRAARPRSRTTCSSS